MVGLWVSLTSPLLARNLSRSGADYVCIDMQHGTADYSDTLAMLMAMEPSSNVEESAIPIVRVPWNEPGIIGRVLDAGAMGVIIPMVNTAAQAAAAVSACKYPPMGTRSHGPIVAGSAMGSDYNTEANDNVACIPMIETLEAVENLDEICAVPGISAFYVGPSDMSRSLGQTPNLASETPEFMAVANTIIEKAKAHGIAPGVHSTPTLTPARLEMGFQMVTTTSDSLGAMDAAKAALAIARGEASGGAESGATY